MIYTAILLFDGLVHLAFVILFNPKGTVADRFPFHAMVRKAIKDKEESAQELNNLAQGEVCALNDILRAFGCQMGLDDANHLFHSSIHIGEPRRFVQNEGHHRPAA